MAPFSKIDMGEVTRLTRAGKLADAMAMLKGAMGPGARHPGDARASSGRPERQTARGPIPSRADAELHGIGQALHALREHLPSLDALAPAGRARPARPPVPDGARFEERSFANHAGARSYKLYVPSRHREQALPVVVMLHGCTQNPDDFAAGTRMNELAEEHGFLVAYPGQPKSANAQKCWNWFDTSHQQRAGGEPALIAGIALAVVEEFSADPARVYVAGLSAGGAAAAIMASTYPEVFAAAGIHSGLACGVARDMPSAFAAMAGNGAVTRRRDGRPVPTIVFHGDGDRTVHPVNAAQVIAQASADAALTEIVTRGETAGGIAYTRTVLADGAGREMLEQWILHGAGHAWSGGSPAGSYTDPRGPDASREMVRFFLAQPPGGAGH